MPSPPRTKPLPLLAFPAPGSPADGATTRTARRLPAERARALVWDIAHLARDIPVFPVERTLRLAGLDQARQAAVPRISWAMLFLKAYALVARRRPVLRRAWVSWPWPHLVEWPSSVGMLAMHREWAGQPIVCWARFCHPEERSLVELQGHLQWYRTQPVEVAFRRQVRFARFPLPLRRLIWWWNLQVAAAPRARRLGTFSISSLAAQGACNRGHPSILTTSLAYGPLDDAGRMVVTLLCDHRVLDGMLAAQVLAELEEVLCGAIRRELLEPGARAA